MYRLHLPAILILGAGLLITLPFVYTRDVVPLPFPDYLSSYALLSSLIIAPSCCLAAAYQSNRIQQLVLSLPSVGARIKAVSFLTFYIPLGGLLGFLISHCIIYAEASISLPTNAYIYLSLLQSIAWTIAGIAIGRAFNTAVALISALLLPYILLAIPPAILSLGRLRHMFGLPVGCCSLDTNLDTRMLLSSIIMLLAITLFSGMIFMARQSTNLLAFAVFIPLCISSYIIAPEGPTAQQARPFDELVCEDRVCHWPEIPKSIVTANAKALRILGDQNVSRVTPINPGQDELYLVFSENIDDVLSQLKAQQNAKNQDEALLP